MAVLTQIGMLAAWLVVAWAIVEGTFVARIERDQRNRTGLEAFEAYGPSRRHIRRVRVVGWTIALLVPPVAWASGLAS